MYKHRVRGRGVALQLSFENTPGKDFKMLGMGELIKKRRSSNSTTYRHRVHLHDAKHLSAFKIHWTGKSPSCSMDTKGRK